MILNAQLATALAVLSLVQPALAKEDPVPPYTVSDANAGTTPIEGDSVYKALHGGPGIARIVDSLLERNLKDPRVADIFKGVDMARFKRVLAEDICYISGGPCHYTGRDMKTAHANVGAEAADFGAVVDNLQWAMDKEGVPFRAQNRLLAKLAPMHRQIITR